MTPKDFAGYSPSEMADALCAAEFAWPTYPDVSVTLTGEDARPAAILARVTRALRASGVPPKAIGAYARAARRGDYDHLLRVTMATVSVE